LGSVEDVDDVVEPVLAVLATQRDAVGRGQVAGGDRLEQRAGQVDGVSEATRIDRGVEHGPRTGGRGAVLAQQFRDTGQVLGDPAGLGFGHRHGQPAIMGGGGAHAGEIRTGERGRHGDLGADQQLSGLGVRIRPPVRRGCRDLVPEPGPQGGQDQHRRPPFVGQQGSQPRGDLLSHLRVGGGQVVVRVVDPHHGVRTHFGQRLQQRVRTRGVEGMPQPPPLR
jgi:hypothetical protein